MSKTKWFEELEILKEKLHKLMNAQSNETVKSYSIQYKEMSEENRNLEGS